MNRTIECAIVKRFYYESHDQLRTHLADFFAAYTFARRLKTLTDLKFICKAWEHNRNASNSIRSSKCRD